jgi:hypothetical protein
VLPIPSPFGQERVDAPVPQAPPPLLRVPPDGELFREQGRAEVYLIRDGALLHIPNPYVMDALGLDWNAVQLVPAGSLDHIPRDSSWDPLAEGTPGSVVHVPTDVGVGANAGKVYWPLRLATTKRHVAWGRRSARSSCAAGSLHPRQALTRPTPTSPTSSRSTSNGCSPAGST